MHTNERLPIINLRLNVNQENEGLVIVSTLGSNLLLSVSECKAGDAEVSMNIREARALLNALSEAIGKMDVERVD
ncbi:hypothetical protein [Paenibacillus mucilaginosus]|uniref:hypothetical protein n=1 Tax=Paenibacillus mucilaginosus TaxID=61624 RepID=UPI00117CD437|nr:hypothetical protein [Paenibacillus mucilaginosus]MCG7214791.1 hypothetical protein [Paenibacillus mucilaginosus]WDM28355.1 hypothetical protein KCX80_03675 [Paenibacillus mucilaginosus]